MTNPKSIRIFDRQAKSYEKRRRKLQLARERSRLLKDAKGSILELSVGAGNNFPFYPSGVHVTAVDFSPKMIEKAKEAAEEYGIDCEFVVSDVEGIELPENHFDTIVSTLSLCAYEKPEKVLEKMKYWVKPGGRILLFEHGKSTNSVYAWLQNRFDALSVRFVGCHQNRDILKMVSNAGIEIKQLEKLMLQSVFLIRGVVQK
ncbi:class I SAM-dependent methyltransferase [Ferdinandcohnia quinoae]|uniref:Class I SAM-dependent methyltransferase n=1 Tax=Fredinandcohnia quinoae TaxID=2918902 RepID=A0AAW5E368_9BACI|nr:class I SAM-dependent methyltransferase [Fredinandcohnia sp. SECRCQ15]MCH1624537.1 class I SAM-dependent methyltransferase [Fredinandcohnia sp. SECRCQ15]